MADFEMKMRLKRGGMAESSIFTHSSRRRQSRRQSGFTLLEVLSVVGIVALLMGLVGSAAFSARQRAYTATATTETQQVASAIRAYWLAFREWPSGLNEGNNILDRNCLSALLGENPRKVSFLQVPPDRFDEDSGQFLDPWGRPYVAELISTGDVEVDSANEVVVSFPIQFGALWQRF